MSIFNILSLLCGLALFLYGMQVMGDALKRSAGNKLKTILGRMTSNQFKGFLLGLVVTAIMQSSSATTVIVVGFVNSGTMTLRQSIGVIMGSNLGTAITSWLIGLSSLEGGEAASSIINWLKPSSWIPILAIIGLCLNMFSKKSRKKDVGSILLGFTVLMVGMESMSDAVSVLKDSEAFRAIFSMFQNPVLGLLAGLILTAIIQSSSASVGILQSLTTTGAITYGAAIPIIMGQNIGTCVTAMISSAGANKNGKRAALIHLYFNVIGAVILLALYLVLNSIFNFKIINQPIGMWGVATVHTIFKILSIAIFAPFYKQLERLAIISVREGSKTSEVSLLEDRLLDTPSIAADCAEQVTRSMADIACKAFSTAVGLLENYDENKAAEVREDENKADLLEDSLGTYLVKLSAKTLSESDSRKVTKLLHIIGDFERISDHAVNMLESAEEIRDKKMTFSEDAIYELKVLADATNEILGLASKAFKENDLNTAGLVEPLEQVIDHLKEQIRLHHILRIQNSECTIEHGFVLSDILTNFERVSDHCSNIAGCIIEISQDDALNMHQYLENVKTSGEEFDKIYRQFRRKYSLSLSNTADISDLSGISNNRSLSSAN